MKEGVRKELFKTEDWLSVWLGFLIIILIFFGVKPQMPTFKWTTAGGFNRTLTESKPASLAFSFLLDPGLVRETKGILAGLRTVWFALAFTSIGLETRFTDLFGMGRGRPAIAFVGAQAFNVIWTLLLAYLLFGGFIFSTPRIQ